MALRSPSSLAAVALVAAACGGLSASPARAQLAQNLVTNGSFELPYVTGPAQLTSIPGWSATNNIEIQPSPPLYTPQEGRQYVEMDATGNTSISQTLSIIPGAPSTFKFYYSPRPGVTASSNGLDVKLDGNTIFSLAANGSSLSNTNWTLYSYAYTPTTSSASIVFTGTGTSDSLGAFVDNVSYTQVPGPLPVIGPVAALASLRRLRRLSSCLRQGQA